MSIVDETAGIYFKIDKIVLIFTCVRKILSVLVPGFDSYSFQMFSGKLSITKARFKFKME